jgi:hypothetical protein
MGIRGLKVDVEVSSAQLRQASSDLQDLLANPDVRYERRSVWMSLQAEGVRIEQGVT